MRVLFIGDICFNEDMDSLHISEDAKNILRVSDFCVCNWEAPIIEHSSKKHKKAGPHVYQHAGFEQLLKEGFITHASLANNHIMDYGKEGLMRSIDLLNGYGIATFGAGESFHQIYQPVYLKKDDVSLGIFGLGEAQFGASKTKNETPGYAWLFSPEFPRFFKEIKHTADYWCVFAHGGLEMEDIPLPEWRSTYHSFIDLGFDFVIGSHPHFIQGKEVYCGKFIYHSLGNFYFNNYHQKDERWWKSHGVQCDISKNNLLFTEHFFEVTGNKRNLLQLSKDAELNSFKKLSDELSPENEIEYSNKIEEIVIDHWERYYRSYFALYHPVKNAFDEIPVIRRIKNYLIRKSVLKGSELMLLHNIRIETHRFVVERALKKITETY